MSQNYVISDDKAGAIVYYINSDWQDILSTYKKSYDDAKTIYEDLYEGHYLNTGSIDIRVI